MASETRKVNRHLTMNAAQNNTNTNYNSLNPIQSILSTLNKQKNIDISSLEQGVLS